MALLIATGLGLVSLPLLAYTYPSFSQITWSSYWHSGDVDVITPALSAFIEETLAAENMTGLSVAVVPKHGPPEFHSWGYRTEDGDEITPDTLFHMASVSKAFCATALGLLIDDFANGRNATPLPPSLTEITWHTRLKDLLPEWQLMDDWASERANLHDILSHVSGLPRHELSYGPLDTPDDLLTRLRYLRPAFELREQWSYNNIMYMVGAHIIATYADKPYTSFVEERIFSPLGMTSSTFSPEKAESSGKFSQGWTKDGRRLPEWFSEYTAVLMAGPGGIISSAADMSSLIPPSVYRNVSYSYAVSPDYPIDSNNSIVGYGMGWFRSSYRGHDVVYHSGSVPGLSTLVSFLPSDEIGVTVFSNGDSQAKPVIKILNRILDEALHLDSSSTLSSADDSSSPKATVKPSAWSPTISLNDLTGTYTNAGYGTFTLCAPSSASSYCAMVHSDFTAVDNAQGNSGPSLELLAKWPRIASSHIRMRYQQGLMFNIDFTTLFPDGYGKDVTPFETGDIERSEVTAEFVIEDAQVVGFGLSGMEGWLWERARISHSVQDRAEVWFDRV
ncbi:beta-lactamase/transpeptidase-like protein [Melanogaster broomeanus]|nr:beta-lactamase/transpeptidase-like protein [Melanogaster broomeanus]